MSLYPDMWCCSLCHLASWQWKYTREPYNFIMIISVEHFRLLPVQYVFVTISQLVYQSLPVLEVSRNKLCVCVLERENSQTNESVLLQEKDWKPLIYLIQIVEFKLLNRIIQIYCVYIPVNEEGYRCFMCINHPSHIIICSILEKHFRNDLCVQCLAALLCFVLVCLFV